MSTNRTIKEDYEYYRYLKDETTRATSLVSKVTLRDGNNSSTVYEYTYDLLGNITLIKKDSANLWGYDYDTLGRLVREDDYTSGNTYLYTYDYSGNIQGKHVWPYITNAPTWHLLSLIGYAEMSSVFYTYGNSSWGDQLTAYDGTTINYDAIGNPTNWRNAQSFTWDDIEATVQPEPFLTVVSFTVEFSGTY